MGEGLPREGLGAEGYRFAVVAPVTNALHNGNLRKYGHVEFFGQSGGAFAAENVVTVVGQFGRCEPSHVFHEAQDGHIDFFVAIHVDALACIGQGHLLRGADNDGAGDGERLQEGEVNIARAGRRVDDEVVEFSPIGFGNELPERVGGHGAAPECGRLRVDEEADGEKFHPVFECRDEELAAFDDVCVNLFAFDAEHFGHGRTENVGIEQAHFVALGGQSHGEVGGDGAFAHPALAGADGNDVFDAGQELFGFGALGLSINGGDFDLHVGADLTMNGSLDRFEEAFHEGVGVLVEDDGETHFHAVDVRLIVEHIGFDDRLSVAGIANTGQDVGDEFGIEGHVKRTRGGGSAFEVDSDATFSHALRIFHHFEVFGVVGVAR